MLYDLDMPSLTPKIIDGKTYYYARYCQRINGKPKIVRQVYLGKVDDLVAAAAQVHRPPQPLETEVAAFGDVAALFDIARQLDLVPLLDAHLPAKRHQVRIPGQSGPLARSVPVAGGHQPRGGPHQQAADGPLVSANHLDPPAAGRSRLALFPILLEPYGPHPGSSHPGV